jgi:hypothetical protein
LTTRAAASVVGAGISSGRGANWRVVGTMMISWAVTIPASALVAGCLLELTRLPTVLAWVTIGCVLGAFGSWAIGAMAHTIHAADVEAEIPSLAELDESVDPHLQPAATGRSRLTARKGGRGAGQRPSRRWRWWSLPPGVTASPPRSAHAAHPLHR